MVNLLRGSDGARLMLCALILSGAPFASASVPDWLRQAAVATLPAYSDEPDAAVLVDETTMTVSSSGEIHRTRRVAYRILRSKGVSRGTVQVYFDGETRLTFLKAWSITSKGEEFELKEGDAVETAAFSEAFYSDTKYKIFKIPASAKGNVIGYEYQQRARSSVLQALWMFQNEIPVRHARFVLELPPNWTYSTCWRNHAVLPPRTEGENRWSWELTDIDPVHSEPKMPSWRSVAGEMGVSFFPKQGTIPGAYASTWAQLATWYTGLSSGRRDSTVPVKEKTRQLTAGIADRYQQLSLLASFVQREIRYVAIEIGIGGYQPHSAADVLASRYGDCKDKATLLSAMLHEAGFDSYYVLINDQRDFVSPEFPSLLNFNHVILAVRVPQAGEQHEFAESMQHPRLGTLVFFDPTDTVTPFGYLPSSLQGNYGLLATDAGDLVQLPIMSPVTNQIIRTAKMNIDSSGNLTGKVRETRTGPAAGDLRDDLLAVPKIQRQKVFQTLVDSLSDGAVLVSASVTDLGNFDRPLIIEYEFAIGGYAQHPGNLFLFRPCVLGRRTDGMLEDKPRQQPVAFSHTAYETDTFEISFPADYSITELPLPRTYEGSLAKYKSELHSEGHVLQYSRMYELKSLRVPLEEMSRLKEFFRTIADDERAYAFLTSSAGVRTQ